MLKQQRRALVCGVTGQDGAYLVALLHCKGYRIWGTTRNQSTVWPTASGLMRLGVADNVSLVVLDPKDLVSVKKVVLEVMPDEIYFLSGQSSVLASFVDPAEAQSSIAIGNLNFLEAIRESARKIRYFNAGSGDCFGDTGDMAATESTPFSPKSPYAIAKASSIWTTSIYRESYGLFACSGILFNHESPLRSDCFVTKKITDAVVRISEGSDERLSLGNIEVWRDWGWAPEYVEAMWEMLQTTDPKDYIIASGVLTPLTVFVEAAFAELGMDWRDYVDIDPTLLRKSDPLVIRADNSAITSDLPWSPRTFGAEVARKMVRERLQGLKFEKGGDISGAKCARFDSEF